MKKPKILIVLEGDIMIRATLHTIISTQFTIIDAVTNEEAIKLVDEHLEDIALAFIGGRYLHGEHVHEAEDVIKTLATVCNGSRLVAITGNITTGKLLCNAGCQKVISPLSHTFSHKVQKELRRLHRQGILPPRKRIARKRRVFDLAAVLH